MYEDTLSILDLWTVPIKRKHQNLMFCFLCNAFDPTKHILQVKYWSLIFSASRSACCVMACTGVGVRRIDVVFTDNCRLGLSSLFLVKVLNRSQTHAYSNNHLYFWLVGRKDIVFIHFFFRVSLVFRHLIILSFFFFSPHHWAWDLSCFLASIMSILMLLLLFIWHMMRWLYISVVIVNR